MFTPSNAWPDTPTARNMRLFAQLMSHKASVETFEAFRAMSLDTLSRIREAQEVLDSIESGRPFESYKSVKEELIWSMERDPVLDLTDMAAAKKFIFHLKIEEKPNTGQQKSRLSVLESMIAPKYKTLLESMIIDSITYSPPKGITDLEYGEYQTANERKLASLSSIYISHLASIGYSKSYILHTTSRFFFTSDVTRVRISKVRSFFDQFDGSNSNFRIFIFVNEQAKDFLVGASAALDVDRSDIPAETLDVIDLTIKRHPEATHVITIRQKAIDIYKAGHEAYAKIRNYLSSAFIGSWNLNLSVAEEVVATTRNYGSSETFKVGHGDVATSRKVTADQRTAVNRSIKEAERIFDKINNDASRESRDRLINSLATAHTAASSQNSEIQLISLWSAFEAMLSAPPSGASSRISHYSKLMMPAICSHYAMRNCIYVSNVLLMNKRDAYKDLTSAIEDAGVDVSERFKYLVAAVALPEHQDAWDQFVIACGDNRLILNLLISLKERFANPRVFYETIDQHEKKVGWQLSRIYRARNQIVHSGLAPNFSDSVAVNAFEYLSTMLGAVSFRLSAQHNIRNVDDVVELMAMNYYSAKEDVKKLFGENRFSIENVFRIFSSVV